MASRKKNQQVRLDETFQSLITSLTAANQNFVRISKLGNLGRPGGLTQFTVASKALSDASQQLFVFVTQHPQYLQAYRDAVSKL
jgi:hypothetical protein